MSVFAVDADGIAYRSACVTQDKGEMLDIIDSTLGNIATVSAVTDMRLYLGGKNNFRYDVAVTRPYKGNRKTEKPTLLKAAREHMQLRWGAIVVDGYEADDAVASDMALNGACHCGVDKDILQIPGRHYNYVKEKWVDVDEDQAVINLYSQVLMGDSSDNIPGLPGIGAVKAAKAISSVDTAETDTKMLYMEIMGDDWHDYYVEQKRLVELVKTLTISELVTSTVKRRLF